MKKIIQTLLCLLVSSTLLVSCGEDVGPTTYVAPQREVVNFDEMGDCDFDEEVLSNAIEQITTLSSQAHSLKKIKEAYDIAVDQLDRLSTENEYYYTAYASDVTDEEAFNKQNEYDLKMTDLYDDFYVALFNVLHSDYRDDMITYINNDYIVEKADEYSALEDDYLDLLDEENTLVQKYNNLDVVGSTNLSEYEQIYLDLIDNRIAQMGYINGYDSYAEYAYENTYHRDYKPEDLDAFREWAKQVWSTRMIAKSALYSDAFNMDGYNALNLTQEEIVSRVQPYVSTISEQAASTFELMVNNNLIDIGASDTKADMGYTTLLSYYGVPYIFNNPYENGSDLETLIHEFGHYYEMYENIQPSLYDFDCCDTAEVNSQGMEVLMLEYADEIFGDEIADTQRLAVMTDLIGVITICCIFDEFQQEAFKQREEGTLTSADQLTDLFISIENSYTNGYTLYGDRWYIIAHTFDSPFYYISYATSAAAALGLFSISLEDRDQAISIYNNLTMMGCQQGFVNSLETVGLPNPFSQEGEAQISEGFTNYVNELIAKHQ